MPSPEYITEDSHKTEVYRRLNKHDVKLAQIDRDLQNLSAYPSRVEELEKNQISVNHQLATLNSGQIQLAETISKNHTDISRTIIAHQEASSAKHDRIAMNQQKQDNRILWMGVVLAVIILGGPTAIDKALSLVKLLF